MTTVGQIERATQNRIVALFRDRLKYAYLVSVGKPPAGNKTDLAVWQ
jgi:hypothetical protein